MRQCLFYSLSIEDEMKMKRKWRCGRNQRVDEDEETYFRYPRSQKRPDQEFEAFEFCLYDDEVEICGWVHGSCHVFYGFDLLIVKRDG